MPSANATLRSHTSTSPGGRTAAEDKLWAALHAHPAATTGGLAAQASIGRSTAAKILAAWATEGSVTRTSEPAPGGRRAADIWRITGITQQPVTAATPDQPEDETSAIAPDAIIDATSDVGNKEITASAPDTVEQQPTITSTTPTPTGATARGDAAAPRKTTRLVKGALRGMVEDYLAERPGEQFSPSAIGKALGRSSGAVSNALDKLIADGYAVQTQDKPKRFTAKTVPGAATPN
ncbi:MAG: MarR family transcriptional regulator [Pseudonocardiaceae bacterium]